MGTIIEKSHQKWKTKSLEQERLHAAAPDLLKACNEMWKWIMKQEDWIGEDPKKEWKVAIQKATKK